MRLILTPVEGLSKKQYAPKYRESINRLIKIIQTYILFQNQKQKIHLDLERYLQAIKQVFNTHIDLNQS
jgi:hypothetical protein